MENKKMKLSSGERTVCEIWTRVMGYFRPTSSFNKGKQSECKDRKCFKESVEDETPSRKD